MNIAYDTDIFCRQRQGGISLHFVRLISQLVTTGHKVYIFCPLRSRCSFQRNIYFSYLLDLCGDNIVYYHNFSQLRVFCSHFAIHVFHFTYYSYRPHLGSFPTGRTFHDVAFLRYPSFANIINSIFRLLFQASLPVLSRRSLRFCIFSQRIYFYLSTGAKFP